MVWTIFPVSQGDQNPSTEESMRIYEVNFTHTKYGANFSRETVCVRGYATDAIRKALSLQNERAKHLRIASVHLLAEGK